MQNYFIPECIGRCLDLDLTVFSGALSRISNAVERFEKLWQNKRFRGSDSNRLTQPTFQRKPRLNHFGTKILVPRSWYQNPRRAREAEPLGMRGGPPGGLGGWKPPSKNNFMGIHWWALAMPFFWSHGPLFLAHDSKKKLA